jgi:secondary thiamine-phosphate synthase enzyme
MLWELSIQTSKEGFYDITHEVQDVVRKAGLDNGIAIVCCLHTTAAITINENADPDVVRDLLLGLDRAFPDRPEFRHREGNSAAHLKSSAIGASETVIVTGGRLQLGTWQGIYFCEFDGPRQRKYQVMTIENS